MKVSAYPRYKPSGFKWLGDIPAHWKASRIGFLATKIGSGKTPRGGAQSYQSDGIMLIRSQNVYDDGLRLEDVVFISDETDEDMAGTRVRPSDVLLNITGASLGRCSVVPASFPKANVNQHVCIVRSNPTKLSPKFAQLALTAQLVKAQIFADEAGSSREGLNFQQVRGLFIAVPPFVEQAAIAACLDAETGRMDRLVEKRRELIERLKEKRIALISRTVTRGLPPEAARAVGLPENPSLKPSGLDWLGDIPAHWEVRKFSREVSIAEGQVDPEKEPYASMLLIGPEHVQSGTGRLTQRATAADQAAESGKYLCRKGDVIYSKIRPALRKLVIAPEGCLCSADMYPLRGRLRLENRFIYWLFLSGQFSAWSVLEADRVAMPKINRDTLNELRMPVPPLPEQVAIAAYLDAETAKLDALVAKVEAAIERLQEYRTALITAAVTGKIDVRAVRK